MYATIVSPLRKGSFLCAFFLPHTKACALREVQQIGQFSPILKSFGAMP